MLAYFQGQEGDGRGGGGGPDPVFWQLLFCMNPASHFLFISLYHILSPNLVNHTTQDLSNPKSRTIF